MKPDIASKFAQPRRTWIPYFVLSLALLLTAISTYYVASTAKAKDRLQFDNAARNTLVYIQDRLDTYINLLRATSGLFAANEQVSRDEFRAFVNRLRLQQRYPGIQGIGFSVRVMPEEKDALVAGMQRQGVKNFTIRPEFKRSEYNSIIYLEPLDRRNKAAIGFDMFTELVRRTAMIRARDTGAPAVSGKVTLIQEIGKQKQAGFLIYVPVYRSGSIPDTLAERRAALIGFAYSPFRADNLMAGIFGNEEQPDIDFQIYDGKSVSPANLLHISSRSTSTSNPPRFRTTKTIDVAGRTWTIAFASRPEFEGSEISLASYMALGGLLISFLLFGVTQSQTLARIAAERSAAQLLSSEKALRERETRYQLVAKATNDAIWDWNLVTNQVEWNEGVQTLFGYTDVKPDVTWWYEHIHPEDRERIVSGIHKAIDKGEQFWSDEYRFLRTDNSYALVIDRGFVSHDEHLKPVRMIGSIMDISDRKQAEAVLRQQAEELAQANRMKDEFLATLSHELRTPLNAILGWTQLLRTRKFNEETVAKALETIERNTKSLAQLIEDVLDVSRIITGKSRVNLCPVELVPIIEAAIDTVLPAAEAKNISLEFIQETHDRREQGERGERGEQGEQGDKGNLAQSSLPSPASPASPAPPALVLGDANRMQQVFWNLLSNAVKFTPKGGRVEVRLSIVHGSWFMVHGEQQLTINNEQSTMNNYAQIRVSDTGQGIEPDFLPYVFDRFRQADSTITRSHGGLGLGLAIVRHLVELHGGTVYAESQGKGQGATFTVNLSLLEEQALT